LDPIQSPTRLSLLSGIYLRWRSQAVVVQADVSYH
jgi:hypothetical protein